MPYQIDLSALPTSTYKEMLKTAYLPPKRRILHTDIDSIFSGFENMGIADVKALSALLKKKQAVGNASSEYATILLREIKSLHPKPNTLADIGGFGQDTIEKLERTGTKNTKQLYAHVQTHEDRRRFSEKTGIDRATIEELSRLADISRIKWAGATFARMMYDAGYQCIASIADADAKEMHEKINAINRERGYYKNQIGLNDMVIFIEAAHYVPQEIIF